ncbi:RNA-binding S4 domain-containing protein [Pseudonocardia sp. H11422]|uniref:RNA-binding S4 domain-containing protein n=1 Tax=Pseudonocardia sp. H11422 TaxID=2835866 RepID=UPI001BDDBF17|nr:RNA-binding S4 domain-containing protein [Pseudonocardia sp. H11422]
MPKAPIRDIEIDQEPIRLGQFLKLAGIAEDGGHARELLETEQVMLNGRLQTRRGTQLRPGDVVAAGEQRARPVLR